MKIWVLKIRCSGEEDDVFLFASKEEAEEYAMHEYYTMDGYKDYTGEDMEEYWEFLVANDIGHFDIEPHSDPLSQLGRAV